MAREKRVHGVRREGNSLAELTDADSEGSEPVSGEESGFIMVASDTTSSGSPVMGLAAADSPAGSGSSSSDLAMRSGSKGRAEVGVMNPWKIKSPRTSAT